MMMAFSALWNGLTALVVVVGAAGAATGAAAAKVTGNDKGNSIVTVRESQCIPPARTMKKSEVMRNFIAEQVDIGIDERGGQGDSRTASVASSSAIFIRRIVYTVAFGVSQD